MVASALPGKFPKPEYYQSLGVYGDSCKNHVQTWSHILSKLKTSFKIFSSIKHLQSSISHRAPGTRCWEFRCTLSCFQRTRITIPPVWSNNSYEIQKNFKCILSNICHCNINTLMRLWVRRGLEIFHFPLRISRLILFICYWPGVFTEPETKHTVEMPFLQRCLFSHKAMARHSHLYHSNMEYTVSCLRRLRGKTLSVINSVFKKCDSII